MNFIQSSQKTLKKILSSLQFQENEQALHSGQDWDSASMGFYSLAEYLQVESFDESTDIYYCKQAKGIVIEAEPMQGASSNQMESFYTFLQRTLPEGTILHCLLYASPHLRESFDAYVNSREGEFFKTLASQRTAFWSKGVFQSLIPWQNNILRDYRLLICLSFDNQLDVSEGQILSLKENLNGLLKSLNIRSHSLKPERFIQWVNNLLRPDDSLAQKTCYYNELDSLSKLLAAPHHHKQILTDRILTDNDWQIQNFRVEDYGRESPHLCEMSDLIGNLFDSGAQIGCPFSLSFIVQICRSSEENFKANYLARRALQRAERIGKFSPKSIKDAHDARTIVSEIENFERLSLISFQISLYCKREESSLHESSLMNVVQSASFKWRIVKNTHLQAVMLLAHLPLGQYAHLMFDLNKLGLLYKVWAKNAAGMLPVIAEPKGMDSPHLMVVGRRGQVFFWDPFANNRGNYNVCVTGISGSGKSVTVQEIACSLIGTGNQVFIIDVGRSYKKLCHLLDGQFVEFNLDVPLCLNPFSIVKAEDFEEVHDFLNFMTPFISTLCGCSTSLESAYIAKAVKAVWQSKMNQGSITDIAHWLLAQSDDRAKDLSMVLYPYTVEGQYGRYFNGLSNINFNKSMVVFELEEISSNKKLQSIVFMLLMYHVTHKMYLGNRITKTSLIVDEAWDMLKGGQGGDIIEGIARRARKYKGSLITITQSLADYFASPAAEAAYKNSYWKLIHMQNASDISTCLEEGKIILSPFQKKLLLSVKTENGVYSEMMILGDGGECALGRLFLDPFSNLLYSTRAEDFAAVNQLCQQGFSLVEAIWQLVKNREEV